MRQSIRKIWAYLIVLLLAGLFTGLVAGCTGSTDGPEASAPASQDAAIQFTDDDGRQVALAQPCTRIISLYSAHTENLFSLGVGDAVIGVVDTSIYPPETQQIPLYDYDADPETVIAAEPDLVLIRPFITRRVPEFVQALEAAGVTVVSLYPGTYDEFEDYINKLAMLTGTEEAAREQLAQFHENIAAITALTESVSDKQSIFFESTETNLRTVTADSMAAHAIAFAGGINVAADAQPIKEGSSIAPFGVERILALADDIDVYVSQRGAMNAGGNLHSIMIRPGFDTIKAIKNGRVYVINEKIISSPTFRFYKGVRELARYLYPEVMDDISAYQNAEEADKRAFANIMVRQLHLPIYVTSSSKYYQTDTEGHIYGLFEDVTWQDEDFDFIETAAMGGYIPSQSGDRQLYEPDAPVTRDMLARAVFILGDFAAKDDKTAIDDLEQCEKPNLVQILVDNDVFELNNGKFEPHRPVTCSEIIDALSFVSYSPID
jgi:iron complex transport system substrate-binding protein